MMTADCRAADPVRRHAVGSAAQFVLDNPLNRLRFDVAENLLDLGAELVDETGRTRLARAHLLLAVQGARGTHLFESVIALCRIGRGVPASMLNRALLEDALDVHWVAANPQDAPVRANEHEQLIRLAERATEVRFGRPTRPLSEDEHALFEVLRKRFNNFNASWTQSSLAERLRLVKERWGEASAQDIDYIYEVIQRQNNVLLHPSPSAYGFAMTERRDQINRMGPDTRWRDALGHGVLGYYLICRVLAEEFHLSKDELLDVFHQASCLLKVVTSEELKGLAPEALCPCGSGRHLAECHRVGYPSR